MKIAILMSIILVASPAVAKTVIIEYPDHYYVEVTGVPAAESATARENRAPLAATPPAAAGGGAQGP